MVATMLHMKSSVSCYLYKIWSSLPIHLSSSAWIPCSVLASRVHASHLYSRTSSMKDMHSFYLIVNLVVLLCQIQSSVAIAVVVVILMQISAMALSSLKRVIPKHLKLFTSSSCTLFSDSLKPRSKGFSYFIPILLELLSWDGVNARCCPSLQTVYHALDLFL